MKKVVIIGASGFVGSAILREALEMGIPGDGDRAPSRENDRPPTRTRSRLRRRFRPAIPCRSGFRQRCRDQRVQSGLAEPGYLSGNVAGLPAYYPEREGSRRPSVADRRRGRKPVRCAGGARDGPGVPEAFAPGVKGLAEVYYSYLIPEKELDWVFFSPAANLVPGERTRKFRLGKDDLIRSVSGESRISVEDYAVAMIDELEKEMHHRERFTIGY